MDVREHDLPGVGKKFAIRTNDDERMTIIIHNTGHREIYHFKPDEDYPFFAIRLEDQEARKLGAILGGAFFQPPVADSMEMVLDQLSVEWLRVEPGSQFDGRTVVETAMREKTGASIIAVLRNNRAIPNPQPQEVIQAGDTLMVVGDREQVSRAATEIRANARR